MTCYPPPHNVQKATFYAPFHMHVNDGFSMVSESKLRWPQLPFISYHLRSSAWYASPHFHRPWVHIALCENYWSAALQSEIWLLQGEHLPCTILICWMQWEAKINFHIVFSARRKRAWEEKPRRRSFLTKCISNKIPLLLTRATGGSAHLKGARCNCSFEKDTVGGRVQYLQPCRIRAHISAKLI